MVSYPWLAHWHQQWQQQYADGRLHHAWLIAAIPGLGVEQLIHEWGYLLLCQQSQTSPCGVCHGCQLMHANTHPDWFVLMPEVGKQRISIEQIRALSARMVLHPQQGQNRVIWLPNAALLTEAAANALLKTLEEPSDNTYFLLQCHHTRALLPTIRSRCVQVTIQPPTRHIALNWLAAQQTEPSEREQTALALAAGAPLTAHELLCTHWTEREHFLNAIRSAIQQQDWLMLLPMLLQADEMLLSKLLWLNSLLIDALQRHFGAHTPRYHLDQSELIFALCMQLTPLALQQLFDENYRCYQQFIQLPGLNRELCLAGLLAGWQQHWSKPTTGYYLPHLLMNKTQ